jgi:hypothetical protein
MEALSLYLKRAHDQPTRYFLGTLYMASFLRFKHDECGVVATGFSLQVVL